MPIGEGHWGLGGGWKERKEGVGGCRLNYLMDGCCCVLFWVCSSMQKLKRLAGNENCRWLCEGYVVIKRALCCCSEIVCSLNGCEPLETESFVKAAMQFWMCHIAFLRH